MAKSKVTTKSREEKIRKQIIKLAESLSKHAADINSAGEWQIVVPYFGNLVLVCKFQTTMDVVEGTYTYELIKVVGIDTTEDGESDE